MTAKLESTYVELWEKASALTPDEAFCRARWQCVMDVLELLDKSGDPDAWFLWCIANLHRHDYSVFPPGYFPMLALARLTPKQ